MKLSTKIKKTFLMTKIKNKAPNKKKTTEAQKLS